MKSDAVTTSRGHVFVEPEKAGDAFARCSWCDQMITAEDGEPCPNRRRVVNIYGSKPLARSIGHPRAVMVALKRTIAGDATEVEVIAHMPPPHKPKRQL